MTVSLVCDEVLAGVVWLCDRANCSDWLLSFVCLLPKLPLNCVILCHTDLRCFFISESAFLKAFGGITRGQCDSLGRSASWHHASQLESLSAGESVMPLKPFRRAFGRPQWHRENNSEKKFAGPTGVLDPKPPVPQFLLSLFDTTSVVLDRKSKISDKLQTPKITWSSTPAVSLMDLAGQLKSPSGGPGAPFYFNLAFLSISRAAEMIAP